MSATAVPEQAIAGSSSLDPSATSEQSVDSRSPQQQAPSGKTAKELEEEAAEEAKRIEKELFELSDQEKKDFIDKSHIEKYVEQYATYLDYSKILTDEVKDLSFPFISSCLSFLPFFVLFFFFLDFFHSFSIRLLT